MQALIERAYLGKTMNATQRMNFYKSLSARGWRTSEPVSEELAPEVPALAQSIATALVDNGLTVPEIADIVGVPRMIRRIHSCLVKLDSTWHSRPRLCQFSCAGNTSDASPSLEGLRLPRLRTGDTRVGGADTYRHVTGAADLHGCLRSVGGRSYKLVVILSDVTRADVLAAVEALID